MKGRQGRSQAVRELLAFLVGAQRAAAVPLPAWMEPVRTQLRGTGGQCFRSWPECRTSFSLAPVDCAPITSPALFLQGRCSARRPQGEGPRSRVVRCRWVQGPSRVWSVERCHRGRDSALGELASTPTRTGPWAAGTLSSRAAPAQLRAGPRHLGALFLAVCSEWPGRKTVCGGCHSPEPQRRDGPHFAQLLAGRMHRSRAWMETPNALLRGPEPLP